METRDGLVELTQQVGKGATTTLKLIEVVSQMSDELDDVKRRVRALEATGIVPRREVAEPFGEGLE